MYGLVLNPLDNGDPNDNYFLFDIQVTASAASSWSIDTYGLIDQNGPTIQVEANLPSCQSQSFVLSQVDPTSEKDLTTPGDSITVQGSVGYGPASATITDTFYPQVSQTKATSLQQCDIQWQSGYCSFSTNGLCLVGISDSVAYLYHFVVGIQVTKGQNPNLLFSATGNFYQTGLSLARDHVSTSLPQSFQMPPITTVTSNPTGIGYVQVDGTQITTPGEFVWNVGDSHQISAEQIVQGVPGIRYVFQSWSDGGTLSHTVAGPSVATTYQANYQQQDRLVISPPSQGTTNPPPATYWYNEGQGLVVQESASSCYQLDNWVLDGTGAGNTNQIAITMNFPHNLTAVFEPEPVLSITAREGGSVEVASSAINVGTPLVVSSGITQTFCVPTGTVVTLTARPDTSYLFGNWTGISVETSNPLSVTLTGNIQESANFFQIPQIKTSTSFVGGTTVNSSSQTISSTSSSLSSTSPSNSTISLSDLGIVAGLLAIAILAGVGIRMSRRS